jgi:hypothetical protein
VISAKSLGRNALAEARVGLGGPVLGSIGARIVALTAGLAHAHLIDALGWTGFFVREGREANPHTGVPLGDAGKPWHPVVARMGTSGRQPVGAHGILHSGGCSSSARIIWPSTRQRAAERL